MFQFLFPDCAIIKERFLLFTKSMVAYREKVLLSDNADSAQEC
jgi:hypothetical protein